MKIKTHLTKNSNGEFIIKATIKDGRRNTIKYFSGNELGVSSEEIPSIDFRSKILEILRSKNEGRF